MIRQATDVQVYEAILQDVNGDQTYEFLRAAAYLKDDRLPPRGFKRAAEKYADIAIAGAAATDKNFNRDGDTEGTGADVVTYVIDIGGETGVLCVQTELVYRSLQSGFVENLFGHDTPAVRRFQGFYEQSDRTPEIVQSEHIDVDLADPPKRPGSSAGR